MIIDADSVGDAANRVCFQGYQLHRFSCDDPLTLSILLYQTFCRKPTMKRSAMHIGPPVAYPGIMVKNRTLSQGIVGDTK